MLSREALFYYLRDSLSQYSEDLKFYELSNPARFVLNGQKYVVHISNIHDSGKGRPNPDEARVQIPTTHRDAMLDWSHQGYTPVFIGMFGAGSVFTAIDSELAFAFKSKSGGSTYAWWSHEKEVEVTGAAFKQISSTNLGRKVTTLSLPCSNLGFYLENIRPFHGITIADSLGRLANEMPSALTTSGDALNKELDIQTASGREKITVTSTRTAYKRTQKFTRDVLNAYNASCCICSKQLKIVEAAHIIPHRDHRCVDTVENGLALCVEHHKLYDDALLLPMPENKLHINRSRVAFLEETGQSAGLEGIYETARRGYSVPEDERNQPNPEFLELGCQIRLGTDS